MNNAAEIVESLASLTPYGDDFDAYSVRDVLNELIDAAQGVVSGKPCRTCATCANCTPWTEPGFTHLVECGLDASTGNEDDTCEAWTAKDDPNVPGD